MVAGLKTLTTRIKCPNCKKSWIGKIYFDEGYCPYCHCVWNKFFNLEHKSLNTPNEPQIPSNKPKTKPEIKEAGRAADLLLDVGQI